MQTLKDVKFDCFHFESSKPCKPHKTHGVFCDSCSYYQKKGMRILVIKFAAPGDVLRTTSILPALHEQFPGAVVYWITAPSAMPIFFNNPYIYKTMDSPEEYLPLISSIEFDLILNLENDSHSSALSALAKGKAKRGFILSKEGYVMPADESGVEWFIMGINDSIKKQNKKTYFRHIYDICGISKNINPPELYLDDEERKLSEEFINKNNLKAFKSVLGINTGSGKRWPMKKWTLDNYVSLLERLHSENPETGLVLFGGPEENEFNAQLKAKLSFQIIDTGTENSMRQFFALINTIDTLFTPDSLGMHVGIALRKNVITYTGPTSYTELDVFGKGDILHSELDCLMCYLNQCDKKVNCMNSLSVEYVISAIRKYI